MQTYHVLRKEERDNCIEGLVKALHSIGAVKDNEYTIVVNSKSFSFTVDSSNLAILAFVVAYMYGYRTGVEYGHETSLEDF